MSVTAVNATAVNATAMSNRFALGLNENPFAPLESVRHALASALREANRYPEFLPRRLPRLIADRIGFGPDQIVMGSGATGVVMNILQEFVAPGDRVVMASPTFDGYPIMTEMLGGVSVCVPLTASGHQDLPAMAMAIDDRTRLAVLCTPHNPTGTCISRPEFDDFLASVPTRVVVVLDEAYIEFVDAGRRLDIHDIIAAHPNVVVLRTFSKAFGLAALRIGYGIGSAALIARVSRWQVPFGINALAEVAVAASFEAQDELDARIQVITRERDYLAVEIRQLGFEVPRSVANCLFVASGPTDAARMCAALEEASVTVKHYAKDGVRITVGDRHATEAILSALRTQ